jgi:trans-aconitate 2-methyltransferase
MWNPEIYLRFADERGRPFYDLVDRVRLDRPRTVVDMGCGPGNLTVSLAGRWPEAQIIGVDSSPEMIVAARKALATAPSVGNVRFEVGDVHGYVIPDDVDVIVTNAMLQWVPDSDEVLTSWVRPGRWIAAQMPANHGAPGHVLLRQVMRDWRSQLGDLGEQVRAVGDAVHHARLLRAAGCEHVDVWQTEYIHQLPEVPDGDHPVLTWMSGTAMRPVRQALSDAGWAAFCAQLNPLLAEAYPATNGVVDFPFLRVFMAAYQGKS